ncbi:MAG: c-type cytochrome [Deltaproteobacteria bacterium]|nr:c-type cytochrome [Deltaproteobacteria bacterium]
MLALKVLMALAALAGPVADGGTDTLTLVTNGKSQVFKLAYLKQRLKTVQVTIEDSLYGGKKKTYDGFALGDVLGLAGGIPEGADEVLFTAKDGYTPVLAVAKARTHRAVVAFEEHGRAKGQSRFEKQKAGKQWVDPAPFYVVWEEGSKLGEEYPRPYQLVRIEVATFAQKYPKTFPHDAKAGSDALKGFALFKNQCLRCHSVNLEGGAIGPELNVPKNITEYWSKGTLRKFIRDVGQFRAASKMPSFAKDLSEDDVERILDYLEFMKDRKQAPQ